MYDNQYDSEFREESRFFKKTFWWLVLALFIISGAGWFFTRAARVGESAVIKYEEFQEIYNSCQKIDSDLATIRAIPETDQMFAQFSKAATIANKRQQMTRWVEEYNAKSRVWTRSIWKSNTLPYQLSTTDFQNYGG